MDGDIDVKDRFNLTLVLFYVFGIMTLISNFFTNANDYWMYKFRDPDALSDASENRTVLQATFTSDFSIAGGTGMVLSVILTVCLMKKIGEAPLAVGFLATGATMFLLTAVFSKIDTDSWQYQFLIASLIMGFMLNVCCFGFLVILLSVVSRFPPIYVLAILSGESVGGIVSAVLQVVSVSFDTSSTTNGLVYFTTGVMFVALTLLGYLLLLTKSEFFRYYFYKTVETENVAVSKALIVQVLTKSKFFLMSIVVVMGSTALINPGVTSLVVSTNKGHGNKWNDDFFVPVITFLGFHVVEFVGRELARKIGQPKNGAAILAISLSRLILVPMLMLCNAQPRKHLPVVFDQDYLYIILILFFGITDGYLSNLCVLLMNVKSENLGERRLVMLFLAVLILAIMFGFSLLSAVMVKAL